jgi:ribosomal RNA-processing protein 12
MQRFESQQSKQDYETLSNVSTKILPSLFKLVENLIQNPTSNASSEDAMDEDVLSSKKQEQANHQQNMQSVESVTDAIGYLARVCPREFLQNLFKKVVQKLLVASTDVVGSADKEENNLRMCSLLGLARSLVASESLDEAGLSLLFRAIRPLVRTDEHDPRVQKRGRFFDVIIQRGVHIMLTHKCFRPTAYKVLTEICERHTHFVTSSEQLDGLIELMIESIVTAQVSVRHMRLKCMAIIVSGFDSSNQVHMVRDSSLEMFLHQHL